MANPIKAEKVKSNSNGGFTETLKYYVMHQANFDTNHNKYYCLELQKHPDGRYRVFTHYGRLGMTNVYEIRDKCNGQPIFDLALAEKEFEHIHKKKLRGKSVPDPDNPKKKVRECYVDVDTVAPTVGSENIRGKSETKKTSSTKISKRDIDTSTYDSMTAKLIDQLIDENVHNITTNTSIKYTSNGFATELGPVTPDHVSRARQPLDELNKLMSKDGKVDPSREVRQLNNAFFSLIPKPFGRKIAETDLILDAKQLQDEFDILDQLETGVQMGSAMAGSTAQKMNALGTDIELLKSKAEFKRIADYITKSKASNHRGEDVWNFKPKRAWKVRIPEERHAFERHGKPKGNVKELFHGSANSNCLSILKSGLIIPRASAGHVTGRLFGDGVYFSDSSTKSLRYSLGYWGGHTSGKGNAFLFLADVAMGKTFTTHGMSYSYRGAKPGFDSTSALKGKGQYGRGLYNSEFIVYSLPLQTLTYVVEMAH